MCSECVQSVLRVCSECVQSVFRVWSECGQSVLRVGSGLAVKISCQDWFSRLVVRTVVKIGVICCASSMSISDIFLFC